MASLPCTALTAATLAALALSCAACEQDKAPTFAERFEELSSGYRAASPKARKAIDEGMHELVVELETALESTTESSVASQHALSLAAVCQWFAFDQVPLPSAAMRDQWLERAARAARRRPGSDYALQIEIERVKLWVDQQQPGRAAAILDACRAEADAVSPSRGTVLSWVYRSKLAIDRDLEAAIRSAQRARIVLEELESKWQHPDRRYLHEAKGWVYGQLVEVWILRGVKHEAHLALHEELGAAEASELPSARLLADMHAIKLYLADGRPRSAQKLCSTHLNNGSPVPSQRMFFLLHRAVAAVQQGDFDGAEADLEAVFGLGLLEGGDLASWRVRQADYQSRAGRRDAAVKTLARLDREAVLQLSPGEQAYCAAVQSSSLWDEADADRRAQLRADLEKAFAGFLGAWRRAPRSSAVSFLEYGQHRMIVGAVVQVRLDGGLVDAEERALRAVLQVQAMSGLARRHGVEAPSLDKLRATLLPPDGGILIYSFSRDRCHVFAVDEERVDGHEIPVRDLALRRAVEDIVRSLATGARLSKNSQETVRQLIAAEVERALRQWRTVTVVGLEELGHVPFAWLPLADGSPVRRVCTVAHLPSVPAGMVAAGQPRRARPAPPDADTLVLTASTPRRDLDLEPLPDDEHAELWPRLLPKSRVKVVEGEAVTIERLREPQLRSIQALWVVCHGITEPGSTALAWSPTAGHDGLVRADDVRSLGSGVLPPLVGLYACNSSLDAVRRGEFGSHGFAGAALEVGARAVVLSPLKLEYGFVKRFARAFDAELARPGATPASALRSVQRQLVATGEGSRAVALLHVVGLGHEPWR